MPIAISRRQLRRTPRVRRAPSPQQTDAKRPPASWAASSSAMAARSPSRTELSATRTADTATPATVSCVRSRGPVITHPHRGRRPTLTTGTRYRIGAHRSHRRKCVQMAPGRASRVRDPARPLSRTRLPERHVQDLGVAVVRRAVLVAVARGHPDVAVRARLDGADPAELTREVVLLRADAAAVDLQRVEPRAALGTDEDGVLHDGDAAARAAGDRPGLLRRDQPAATGARGTFATRPAVVAALLDEVDLVHDGVAELLLP